MVLTPDQHHRLYLKTEDAWPGSAAYVARPPSADLARHLPACRYWRRSGHAPWCGFGRPGRDRPGAEAQRAPVGNGHTRVAAMRLLTCGSFSTLQTMRSRLST